MSGNSRRPEAGRIRQNGLKVVVPGRYARDAATRPRRASLLGSCQNRPSGGSHMGWWILLAVIVVVAAFVVIIYNRLVSLRQTVGQSWSDISVQLKQRHDLIPNLVETVKGYAAHERGTLEAVVQARNAAVAANGPAAQA